MLGPNKRPTRVHPDAHNGGINHVGDPTTPNYLHEQQPSFMPTLGSYGIPSTRAQSSRLGILQIIKARFGVKSSIACFLFLILIILIWRHENRPRIVKPSSPPVDPASTPPLRVNHGQTHVSTTLDVEPASGGGPSVAGPAHVHPAAFEWTHEQVKERKPPNFALNGEHPQFNDEKLTPIFERPRVAGLETPGLVTSIVSPSSRLKLSVLMSEEGRLGYMVDVLKPDSGKSTDTAVYLPLLAPAFMELNANFQACSFRTDNAYGASVSWSLEYGESLWRPVPGNERRTFRESYQQVKVWCVGRQCLGCNFLWEYRLYDHALAVRAVVDGKSIDGFPVQPQADTEAEYVRLDFGMEVKWPQEANAVCWAQNSEDPFVKKTCGELSEPMMTPITMVLDPMSSSQLPAGTKPPPLPFRYLSILQADGPAFMRSTGQIATGSTNTLNIITKGELPIHALENQIGVIEHSVLGWSTPTSWNVILIGDSPAELVHHNSIIYLLCPPPSDRFPMALDGRWISHGKSLRARGHTTQKAKYLIDFAATYNYQMIHFDAGWYGDENNRTSDPRMIAPEFLKELSISEVANYGRMRGIGVTVYVNEIALKYTNELIEIYPRWNLHGIKFGFVDVNSPKAMRILMERIIAYQHVGMSVNVHDIYRPRGLTRTWPHLVTQEGVRGEERKPDAWHHTILPFTRYLQGAADYTPRYLKGALRCTRAHQLALPFLFFTPIQSLFWAEPGQAIVEAVQLYHPELVIWQIMPTTWDDTRVLHGEIGEYVSIARRTGEDWFIGTITNTMKRELTLNLSTLFDHTLDGSTHPLPFFEQPLPNKKGYMVHLYEDDHDYKADFSVETNLNNIRVKLRQQFILPAVYSTMVHHVSKQHAINAGNAFPNDPISGHLSHLQEYRKKVVEGQEKQLIKMFEKEGVKTIPTPKVLDSPLFKIKMAPSGGSVIYITPIV